MSAGLGTSHASGIGTGFGTQTKHNWSENIGLTLNIPIFNKRSTKTAVNLAKLNIENAQLNYENVQKELLKSVETVYQDAVSAAEPFPFGPGESDRYRIVFRAYSGAVFPESKKYGRIDDGEKQLAGCPARVDTSQIYGDPESAIVEFLSGYMRSVSNDVRYVRTK